MSYVFIPATTTGTVTFADLEGYATVTALNTKVGVSDGATLTNKTIIGETNIVSADRLETSVPDQYVNLKTSTAPTTGQALIATSTTAAGWNSYDHVNLTNKGTNTHTQIDTHIASVANPHAVSHTQLTSGIGTNTHAQIDTHIASVANPHAVSHTQLTSGIGTNTHAQIDSFIASKDQANGLCGLSGTSKVAVANLPINDVVAGANNELWSSAYSKSQMDAIAGGFRPKQECKVYQNANIAGTYSPNAGTITVPTGVITILIVDGVTLSLGDRILFNGQTDQKQNGSYALLSNDAVATVYVRTPDLDGTPSSEIAFGSLFYISSGTVWNGSAFSLVSAFVGQTSPITINDPNPANNGPLTFSQVQGPTQLSFTAPNLSKVGTVVSLNSTLTSMQKITADRLDVGTTTANPSGFVSCLRLNTANGSVIAPAISLNSNADHGLFMPTASSVGITLGITGKVAEFLTGATSLQLLNRIQLGMSATVDATVNRISYLGTGTGEYGVGINTGALNNFVGAGAQFSFYENPSVPVELLRIKQSSGIQSFYALSTTNGANITSAGNFIAGASGSRVQLQLGTVSSPSVNFGQGAAADTGIYAPVAGHVAVSCSGILNTTYTSLDAQHRVLVKHVSNSVGSAGEINRIMLFDGGSSAQQYGLGISGGTINYVTNLAGFHSFGADASTYYEILKLSKINMATGNVTNRVNPANPNPYTFVAGANAGLPNGHTITVTAAANLNVTSLTCSEAAVDGRIIVLLCNTGSGNITFVANNLANGFFGNANKQIRVGEHTEMRYVGTLGGWSLNI